MATKTGSSTDVSKFLSGIDYPADKSELISYAKSKNAPADVIDSLNSLPDMEFNNSAEVSGQFGETSQGKGGGGM